MHRDLLRFVPFLFVLCFFVPGAGCGDDDDHEARPAAPLGRPPTSDCAYVPASCEELDPRSPLPEVIASCKKITKSGTYFGTYVHIVDKGALYIDEVENLDVDIKVSSLLVEYGGVLQAGSASCPFGERRGKLTFSLWGDDPSREGRVANPPPGIQCETGKDKGPHERCFAGGAQPMGATFCTGDANPDSPDTCNKPLPQGAAAGIDGVVNGPDGKNFLLEHYGNLNFDGSPFGYKTLSVSYGGSLRLFGHKGTEGAPSVEPKDEHCRTPDDTSLTTTELGAWAQLSGSSWARLDGQDDDDDTTTITLDRQVNDWSVGDDIVIGPTDWYPGHAEQRTIRHAETVAGKTTLVLTRLRYPHQAKLLDLDELAKNGATFTGTPKRRAADLRAPVGLLSRSIRIRSLGRTADDEFPSVEKCMIADQDVSAGGTQDPACYFGGHVMFRQGFRDVQIQGTEFKQLGQGGRMGHYPVHFHLAKSTRYTNNRAFVKDSSIWDSMTRFVALHGSHDVTVARNVGYLSTGHGFYGEDSSEINNRFCHNLGVEARAPLAEYYRAQRDPSSWSTFDRKKALAGGQSQDLKAPPTARFIPPILDGITSTPNKADPIYRRTGSDALMPVMFWVMNAYNELVGNVASGVHGFGSCYWLLGSGLSGASRHDHEFDGLAAANGNGDSQAPLLRFRGNSCSSAALALPASPDLPPQGFGENTGYTLVQNPYLYMADGKTPKPREDLVGLFDRPLVVGTFRPINPSSPQKNCASTIIDGTDELGKNQDACVTTIIDRFTTSFNWAEVNFGPIWLRPWWYLVTNSAITDQLNAGLTFISAGSWEQVPPGYFSLVQDSLFAGSTQFGGSPYAKRSGPILRIKHGTTITAALPACDMGSRLTCNILEEGTGYWTGGFQPKRLLNIYDGPAYAGGNTFINVGSWKCDPQPCAREGRACTEILPCAEDQKDEGGGTCDKEYPCGIYAFTRQPHPGQPPDPLNDAAETHKMIVMDAAIGWKQPNGFYYPPAFAHADEIFFKTPPKRSGETGATNGLNQCWGPDSTGKLDFQPGDCRHNAIDRTYTYVIGQPSNLRGDPNFQRRSEIIPNRRLDVSPIDFQTILVDLDGTLTGATATLSKDGAGGLLANQPTASVSRNPFFDAPLQTDECLSFGVQTTPYQFVTTALGKLKASPKAGAPTAIDALDPNWASRLTKDAVPKVIGGSPMVPIYRQWRLEADTECGSVCDDTVPQKYGCTRASFMMGPDVGQAIHLTLAQPRGMPDAASGGGFYYIDTNAQNQSTACVQKLDADANKVARFAGGQTYVVYNLFARNDTKISYSFYVGDGAASVDDLVPTVVKVDPHRKPAFADPRAPTPDAESLVSFFCDARSGGACKDYVSYNLADRVLTVTLDHAKVKEAYLASARTPKEQCLTRDMCRFDGGQCKSCWDATGNKHADCTKPTESLAADVKALSGQLTSYCEDWSQLATGTRSSALGERSLVDCPEGGCLGLAFTLPAGFTPRAYKDVFPAAAPLACFPQNDWTKNALVPRKSSSSASELADPLCGSPKPTASFCP